MISSTCLLRVIPRPAARTGATLLAWTVPVVQPDAGAALAAIDEPVADIRYGASVGYLAELAAFARELVERGRVLPELRRDTNGAIACWRPLLQGRDVVAMTSLTSAMPPVCRAERGGHDPHELVVSALDGMVNAVVRAALPRIDVVPPGRGRSTRRPAVEDWLTALTGPNALNSIRWPRRCARGTVSAPAWSARPGRRSLYFETAFSSSRAWSI